MNDLQDISELESKIGYTFQQKELLDEALRHSSFVNERPESPLRDNERFEFLGDAVINLVVGQLLMERFPDLPEGDLSRMRANLVNETSLADISKNIGLGEFIRLGKGEIMTHGKEKPSILANTFEALSAAVYLDGGFPMSFNFIRSIFSGIIRSIIPSRFNLDHKSRLQEIVQTQYRIVPVYRITGESGPDHDKTFFVEVDLGELRFEGVGKSKKMAEQDAAKNALEHVQPDPE